MAVNGAAVAAPLEFIDGGNKEALLFSVAESRAGELELKIFEVVGAGAENLSGRS